MTNQIAVNVPVVTKLFHLCEGANEMETHKLTRVRSLDTDE